MVVINSMITAGKTMITIDLKRELKTVYTAAKQPTLIDVPPLSALMIDGSGDPNTAQRYQDAVQAIFSAAYNLRFSFKKRGIDFKVMPLEGWWWVDDRADFSYGDKSNWQWTLLIVQPDAVTPADFERARDEVRRKKNPPALADLRLGRIDEGRSAQILHVGPFADEPATIERLHTFIEAEGMSIAGKHHEIYLNDFKRTAPEKLKTIIRYPVRAT